MTDSEDNESTFSLPYLWREDGERFSRNEDGTYTMDSNKRAQPTCFYRYTFGRLMDTGSFSVYPPNSKADTSDRRGDIR